MTIEQLNNSKKVELRYYQPVPLLELVREYQESYKAKTGNKRAPNKEHLITLMCLIGIKQFKKEIQKLKKQ